MADDYPPPPIQLPQELAKVAQWTLFQWPNSNDALFDHYAAKWLAFRDNSIEMYAAPDPKVRNALKEGVNTGEAARGFEGFWTGQVPLRRTWTPSAAITVSVSLLAAGAQLVTLKQYALKELKALHDYLNRFT